MEFEIPLFEERYSNYCQNINELSEKVNDSSLNESQIVKLLRAIKHFQDLDVKLRLAFAIKQITLNPHFVNEKQGDLRDCHLMYYKFADLWFAYEAFIKFDKAILGTEKNKILFLDTTTHADYSSNQYIDTSFELCSHSLREYFGSARNKSELINYLQYCTESAQGGQLNRLNQIINNMSAGDFDFVFKKQDILTISYSVRNNFVHNGESTIVPDNFGFVNKKLLLNALYKNLAMLVVEATNISCSKFQVT